MDCESWTRNDLKLESFIGKNKMKGHLYNKSPNALFSEFLLSVFTGL